MCKPRKDWDHWWFLLFSCFDISWLQYKKIKLASTENLDKGLLGMMEGVSKGISTGFVNPEEWNSYSEYSGEKFENLVTSACKK